MEKAVHQQCPDQRHLQPVDPRSPERLDVGGEEQQTG
jgi:hypothetical protein